MKIKQTPEDFVVEEIGENGTVFGVGAQYKFDSTPNGENIRFIIEKKNWETIKIGKEVCKRLGMGMKRLGFAGNKDRRSISTQLMSLWNVKLKELEKVKIKDATIKPLCYGERVNLGDLQGNRFTITIRSFQGEIKSFSRIPNFFGPQRFGEARPVSHLVGECIVEERFKDAAMIYLCKTSDSEPSGDREARKKLEKDNDFRAALAYFPKHLGYELAIISHLANAPNDYVGALRALPRKLLTMLVHAYQSWLFNKVLEKRLELGLDPLEGDILEDGVPTGPLYGFGSKLASGKQGEIERTVIEKEWVELKNFQLKGMPDLSSQGIRRKLFVETEVEVLEKGDDFVKIRFSLPKGCYATTALDWIVKHPCQ